MSCSKLRKIKAFILSIIMCFSLCSNIIAQEENEQAINIAGIQSINTTQSSLQTQYEQLSIPSNIQVKNELSKIVLTWDEVEGAEGYEIEMNGADIISVVEPSYVHNVVFEEKNYTYRIRAVNSIGKSEWSNVVVGKTGKITDIVKHFSGTALGKSKIEFVWDKVEGARYYDIEINGEIYSAGEGPRYIHTNLEPNTTYTCRIRPMSEGSVGEWNKKIYTATCALDPPRHLRAMASDRSITLMYDAVDGANYYEIEKDGIANGTTSKTSYTCSSLDEDEEYSFRVRAINNEGDSPWSEILIKKTASTGENIEGAWFDKGFTDRYRYDAASSTVNGKIYIMGGTNNFDKNYMKHNLAYDPTTNTWETKADMPTARYSHDAVEVNGKIYVIGGNDDRQYLGTVEIYDPQTDTWQTGKSMPTPRAYLALTVANGKIYAIGGYNLEGYLTTVEEYDPVMDEWMTVSSMHKARSELAAVTLNGKIYAIAGYNGEALTEIEMYDPQTDTWVEKGLINVARRGLEATVKDNKIIIMGGATTSKVVEVYNPEEDTYTFAKEMEEPRYAYCLEMVDNKIYVIGGTIPGKGLYASTIWSFVLAVPENRPPAPEIIYAFASNSNINIKWTPIEDVTGYDIEIDGQVINVGANVKYSHNSYRDDTIHTYRVRAKNNSIIGEWSEAVEQKIESLENMITGQWVKKDVSPVIGYSAGSTVVNGEFYIMGSFGNDMTVNTRYNPISNTYEYKAPMPTGRGGLGLVAVGNKIYAIGGYDKDSSEVDTVEVYDTVTDTWETKVSMPTPRSGLSVVTLNNKIYAIGGRNGKGYLTTVEEYDIATDTWRSVADITTARSSFGAVTLNGKIYVIGGYNVKDSKIGTIEEYDPQRNQWIEKGQVTARHGLGAISAQGKIFIISGYETQCVEEYDPITNSYVQLSSIPEYPRYGFHLGEIDNKFYVIGGYGKDNDIIRCFTLNMKPKAPKINLVQTGINSITIEWSPIDDAISYEIEIDGEVKALGNQTSYCHTTHLTDRLHHYRVRAVSSTGKGQWSEMRSNCPEVTESIIINTAEDLSKMKDNLSGHYKLGKDIDLDYEEWIPIGTIDTPFTGVFDGNGYTIRNLKISKPDSSGNGLFGAIEDAYIENVSIQGVDIIGGKYTGALIGKASGSNKYISNCEVKEGKVTGIAGYTGGLIGGTNDKDDIETTYITKCTAYVDIYSQSYTVGGLIGGLSGGVSQSCAKGQVIAKGSVGGLIGSLEGHVSESYAIGKVQGLEKYEGGLVGYITQGSIVNSYAISDVEGSKCIGGIVGANFDYNISSNYPATIKNCYARSKLKGENNVGGISGTIDGNLTVSNSYYDRSFLELESNLNIANDDYGKTTSKLVNRENYKDWDFEDTWDINQGESYPYLRKLSKPLEVEELKTKWLNGFGSKENPYIIETKEQLMHVKDELNCYYVLGGDIDLEGLQWEPIGSSASNQVFTGYFDGNGYEISNFKINRSDQSNIGFFGVINNATIKNLNLSNVEVSGKDNVGGLVGYAKGEKKHIENCHVSQIEINGQDIVGGLIGFLAEDTPKATNVIIGSSVVEAVILARHGVGGLIGKMLGGTVTRSFTSGITIQSNNGSSIGGLVGSIKSSIVNECYAEGDIQANEGERLGGASGYSDNSVFKNSFALMNIEGKNLIGGILGKHELNENGPYIVYNPTEITNCYAAVRISSTGEIGGIVPETYIKGISVTNSYYDGTLLKDTDGNMYENMQLNHSKRTEAMKSSSSYKKWDFINIWMIDENDSYPYLRKVDKPKSIEDLPLDSIEGLGTELSPYIITTKEQLMNIKYDLDAYYELGADIDLEDIEWEPIGQFIKNPFSGKFDGKGHTISHLKMDRADAQTLYTGLFGIIEDATIQNLYLSDVQVEGKNNVGSLVGYARGKFNTISNCHIRKVMVSGENRVGGLLGNAQEETVDKTDLGAVFISNSSVEANVIGKGNVGGVAGYMRNGEILRSYARCFVESTSGSTGGLVGGIGSAAIRESYALGTIKGNESQHVGGLVGYSTYGSIKDSYAIVGVSGNQYVGGILGYSEIAPYGKSYITNCYAAGLVNAKQDVGGVCSSHGTYTLTSSYYDGSKIQLDASANEKGKITTGMNNQSTYLNWDFETIWAIDEGMTYPYLRNVCKPDEVLSGEIEEIEITEGSGTQSDPYIIYTKGQLKGIKDNLKAYYKLGRDIDLGKELWIPIGQTVNTPFSGGLDGNGYTISNLTIKQEESNYVGLFGVINNAKIYNLTISDVNIVGNEYTGALVGYATGAIKYIVNCRVEKGRITGTNRVGGLIGATDNTSSLYFTSVNNCSSDVTVIGTGSYIGGLIGYYRSQIQNCYATGDVEGYSYLGGLIGWLDGNAYGCYTTGNIEQVGTMFVGGLVGYAGTDGSIMNSYSLSNINGNTYVGGIIGYTATTFYIANCLYSGMFKYQSKYGGISGNTDNVTISSSYYDANTTGLSTGNTNARTTDKLTKKYTFSNWNFTSIWDIEEGKSYPYLRYSYYVPIITATKVTSSSITLSWPNIENAQGYELKIDGNVIQVNGTSYVHDNLLPNTEHSYSVRPIKSGNNAPWSSTLTVRTTENNLLAPDYISIEENQDGILISWDAVNGATSYEIEVDGKVVGEVRESAYLHRNPELNVQHTYRVRAKDRTETTSKWSKVIDHIKWQDDTSAVALIRKYDIEGTKVALVGHSINNLYTMQVELQYNPQEIHAIEESLKTLIAANLEDIYVASDIDPTTGTIQLLLSLVGEQTSESMDELLEIEFEKLIEGQTTIALKSIQLVNQDCEYISIPDVKSLTLN